MAATPIAIYYAYPVNVSEPSYRPTQTDCIPLYLAMTFDWKHAAPSTKIPHPEDDGLSFLCGTIFTGVPRNPVYHPRHLGVFADDEVARSPRGTGVSAKLAILAVCGQLSAPQKIAMESV